MDVMRAALANPRYIGTSWDGDFMMGDKVPADLKVALQKLIDFDWLGYSECQYADERTVAVPVSSGGTCTIAFEAYAHFADVLSQLPGIDFVTDPGPSDGGPAAGSGVHLFVAAGRDSQSVSAELDALHHALEVDFRASLSQNAGGFSRKQNTPT